MTPTPIQAQAIPHVLAGRDVLGTAQTGTGKTAAFALPILHRLAADRRPAPRKGCRALILSPTRQLATQIADSFRTYGRHLGFSVAVVFGGVGAGPQIQALARGIDVLVATPGRLLDHMQSGFAKLDQVETLVLDEADQMLDMGFIPAIRRIVKTLPAVRLNLFFSATMPPEIGKLAAELLNRPERVSVAPVAAAADRVEQRVIHVAAADKRARLTQLLRDGGYGRTLVFARTKHGADRIVKGLEIAGIRAVAIHGNKSQSQRQNALDGFKSGRTPILVATDIAARGIDVDNVTHVINFDLPHVAESYVHRIGRTARAGATGMAISLVAPDERQLLRAVERLIRQPVQVMGELPPLPICRRSPMSRGPSATAAGRSTAASRSIRVVPVTAAGRSIARRSRLRCRRATASSATSRSCARRAPRRTMHGLSRSARTRTARPSATAGRIVARARASTQRADANGPPPACAGGGLAYLT